MNNALPAVVIVGRPNVGKSSIFNALIGRRFSIVHSESGVTRDRVSANLEWDGYNFQVIDTGGIYFYHDEKEKPSEGMINIRKQVEIAIEAAEVILFATDITAGATALDEDISAMLRRSGKKVLLVMNKSDNDSIERESRNFRRLGWNDSVAVSCAHRRGFQEMLGQIVSMLPEKVPAPEKEKLKIAVVGRPNAGKSSIINRILNEERVIVSSVPGTTRDSVDIEYEIVGRGGKKIKIVLIETAGLRQKRKADTAVEMFSIMRTEKSIRSADIVLLVTEADSFGATAQDKKIGRMIHDAGRGCIILANKSDLLAGKEAKEAEAISSLRDTLPFLNYAPIVLSSAVTGKGIEKIADLILRIDEDMETLLPTALVNRFFTKAQERNKPSSTALKAFKIYYATMKSASPPIFILFVNDPDLCPENYKGYLKNFLLEEMKFTGLPVHLQFRKRKRD